MAGKMSRHLPCPLVMRNFLIIPIFLVFFFLLDGCASRKELVGLQYDVNRLRRQVVHLGNNIRRESDKKIARVDSDLKESIGPVRKSQADINVRLDSLQTQLQSLKGKIEECRYLLGQQTKENASLKKRYESKLEKRLLILEGFFISEGTPSSGKIPTEGKSPGEEKGKAKSKKPTSKELYSKAYDDFKKGDIKAARIGFRKYLRLFPNTDYSDNAQYWLGEFFFVEKKYKEAILEFDEVIRKYPKGNKVPPALLKQGLAFYRLGDKTSAKLILQKVVKKYPRSNQAKIARKELKKLPDM